MAITLADFNKIWASSSPLTPYSFSDDNYNEGWNFIGQIPPSRQMWDFLQKNNDEKMKYLADNYLPLSGGTMTGGITSSIADTLKRNVNTDGLTIIGGNSSSSSAFLKVFGGNATGLKGYFALKANDGTNSAELQGRPNGTLTWNGNDIALAKDCAPIYGVNGNAVSITVPAKTYLLVVYRYSYGVPSSSQCYVGLIGGDDFNDGTQHIGVVDILKGSDYANIGLSYSITTDGTKKITVSSTSTNINISLIRVFA